MADFRQIKNCLLHSARQKYLWDTAEITFASNGSKNVQTQSKMN